MNVYAVEVTNGPPRPVEADSFEWEKDQIIFHDTNGKVVASFNPVYVVSVLMLPEQDK